MKTAQGVTAAALRHVEKVNRSSADAVDAVAVRADAASIKSHTASPSIKQLYVFFCMFSVNDSMRVCVFSSFVLPDAGISLLNHHTLLNQIRCWRYKTVAKKLNI